MFFEFKEMNEHYANIIVQKGLDAKAECYNVDHEPEDIDDLLDKEDYDFFVAEYEEEVIGFLEVYFEENIMEVGVALLPEYKGQGFGTDFVAQGIEYLIDYYAYSEDVIRSFISVYDKRALKVLKRVGFVVVDQNREWYELEIILE